MTSYEWQTSSNLKDNINSALEAIEKRIEAFGYTFYPFQGDRESDIPAGWVTIGLTRVGLPELYISGISPHSEASSDLIMRIKMLYDSNKDNGYILTNTLVCNQVNEAAVEDGKIAEYQWRPVDRTRILYGQSLLLRYWLERNGLTEQMSGIQIVHRDSSGVFPMVSTPSQLLIDYVPFGTKLEDVYANTASI